MNNVAIDWWSTFLGDKEAEAAYEAIKDCKISQGVITEKLEHRIAESVGAQYCVVVPSGSMGLLLSMIAIGISPGDEVIVPAVSWSTTYFPLQQYGLKLKFVDIDLETLNYDLSMLKSAITSKTKMIMVVNLLGNPNDFDVINSFIKDKDIFILEDNCESMGAEYRGRQTGTFGIISTFSTFFSHHMATMEGGFVTTDDEELYHVLLSLRAHGWTRNLPQKNHVSNKSNNWFEESFRFVLPGYNIRPVEMSGAIGIEQLKKLPKFLRERRKNAKLFVELFRDHPDFIIQKDIDNSSWFGFSLIIRPSSKLKRQTVITKLQKNQIECRPIVTGNFTRNHVMKYFDYKIHKELTNAEYLHENGFFVGNSHDSIEEEIRFLAKCI